MVIAEWDSKLFQLYLVQMTWVLLFCPSTEYEVFPTVLQRGVEGIGPVKKDP